jgi:RNA polymerase sigma factor (sigma-70 family)
MKTFRVLVKMRNNLLIERREELGLSPRQFAEKVGLNYGLYLKLESMRDSPLGANGDWRPAALWIAEYHAVSLDELWPEAVRQVEQASAMRLMDRHELAALGGGQAREARQLMMADPDLPISELELRDAVTKAVGQLCPRDEGLLRARFGHELTLEELGEQMSLSKQRVLQRELRAMRKLRRPGYGLRELAKERLGEDVVSPMVIWGEQIEETPDPAEYSPEDIAAWFEDQKQRELEAEQRIAAVRP